MIEKVDGDEATDVQFIIPQPRPMKATIAALAITVACSIAAAPQMPAAAQAEIAQMEAKIPQVRHSPDAATIIAAKATGKFTTDGKEPQFVRNKEISMGGKTRKAVAMDGVKVGEGEARTMGEQRFLEMNGLVQNLYPRRHKRRKQWLSVHYPAPLHRKTGKFTETASATSQQPCKPTSPTWNRSGRKRI